MDLKLCVLAGAIALTVLALLAPQKLVIIAGVHTDTFFVLICAALAMWGICQGVASAPLEALLADSVPTGIALILHTSRALALFPAGPGIATGTLQALSAA